MEISIHEIDESVKKAAIVEYLTTIDKCTLFSRTRSWKYFSYTNGKCEEIMCDIRNVKPCPVLSPKFLLVMADGDEYKYHENFFGICVRWKHTLW